MTIVTKQQSDDVTLEVIFNELSTEEEYADIEWPEFGEALEDVPGSLNTLDALPPIKDDAYSDLDGKSISLSDLPEGNLDPFKFVGDDLASHDVKIFTLQDDLTPVYYDPLNVSWNDVSSHMNILPGVGQSK